MTVPGSEIAKFFAHFGVFQFASNLAGVFFIAFMLHQGAPPAIVFSAIAAMHFLRLLLRPLVLVAARAIGPRRS